MFVCLCLQFLGALIIKRFSFAFVNNYLTLFYLLLVEQVGPSQLCMVGLLTLTVWRYLALFGLWLSPVAAKTRLAAVPHSVDRPAHRLDQAARRRRLASLHSIRQRQSTWTRLCRYLPLPCWLFIGGGCRRTCSHSCAGVVACAAAVVVAARAVARNPSLTKSWCCSMTGAKVDSSPASRASRS